MATAQDEPVDAVTAAEAPPVEAEPAAVAQIGGACSIVLANGPPPKPERGKDFGSAVARNTGKTVQRGIIQQIGGRIAGGLGAAVGGAVANSTIRNEEDIKGIWTITDGSSGCACTLRVDGLFQMQGKGKDSGSVEPVGCASPTIAAIRHWALGYSFTGYDAKFDLRARDRKSILATLNRDGIHYFSGNLADGTPVVMWREKQNYMEMKKATN